ncbi:MAG TPA: type II secretion system protein N [Burkholderiales bacterium]|nr:type II secretion system protein N [Burkholderiales bacterium]
MTASSISVAQRFTRSAGSARAVLAHRAMPALATVAALLLLCWTLAQGTWRVLQPASPAVARAGGADLTDLRALGGVQLFGRAVARSAAAETSVAPSNLNMTLTGVAMRAAGGCALVIVQGQPESAFCSGEELSPGVRLDTVQRDRIVIVRNGAREALIMKDVEGAAAGIAVPLPPIVQSVGTDRQLVDRRQLQQQLGRPEFLNQALIVPNADGGFLVRQVQAGSLYEKLGLRPGDVIRNVNGQPLTSMDDVMRLYQQFGTAQRVLVDVQRQGRNETLYYDMR